MQRKCHRCDRLYTPIDHNTWCPDCMAGKPVVPRKTKKQVEKENKWREHISTQDIAFSVERSSIQIE